MNPMTSDDFISMMGYRTFAINRIIDDLSFEPNPNDYERQRAICRNSGINLDDLTDDEIEYIQRKVQENFDF